MAGTPSRIDRAASRPFLPVMGGNVVVLTQLYWPTVHPSWQERRKMHTNGVWIAFYFDFSGFAIFSEELEARRYAGDHHMQVEFIEFGQDVPYSLRTRT